MRKRNVSAILVLIFLAFLCFSASVMAQEAASAKPTAVIMNIEAKDIPSVSSLILTGKIYDSVNNIGAFTLLSPNDAYQIFQEKKFKQVKSADIDYLVKAGNVLGVDKIITGSVFKKDGKCALSLSLFNVKENLTEKEYTKEFDSPQNLDQSLNILALKLSDKPVLGEIIIDSNAEGAEVYCDGNISGKTPCAIKNIAMGEHKIKLVKADYRDNEQTVTLDEDNLSKKIKMDLKTKAPKVEELTDEKVKELWKTQNSGVQNDLLGVFALDDKNAWAVGESGLILHTSDGGQTWEKQENKVTQCLNSVFFTNANTGWACGAKGTVINTTDGGKTWSQIDLKTTKFSAPFNKIAFVNDKEGFILGGAVAINPAKTAGYLFGAIGGLIVGLSEEAYLKDNGSIVLYTQDGGKSWEHLKSAKITNYFGRNDLCALGGNKIITVGRNGIFYSEDKGKTWQAYKQPNEKSNLAWCATLNAICFANDNEGWIGGAEGEPSLEKGGANGRALVLRTSDGGKTWEMKKLDINGMINEIYFLDKSNGWALGKSTRNNGDSFVLYTSDGGNNWKEFDFHDDALALDAYFVNPDCGWLVGKKGVIYKYENK